MIGGVMQFVRLILVSIISVKIVNCQSALDCTFEDGSCGYSSDPAPNLWRSYWATVSASGLAGIPSLVRGSGMDHTSGSRTGKIALITFFAKVTPTISPSARHSNYVSPIQSTTLCYLEFYYSMPFFPLKHLSVYLGCRGCPRSVVWAVSGFQGGRWNRGLVDLQDKVTSLPFRVSFNAQHPQSIYAASYGLDDIHGIPCYCASKPCQHNGNCTNLPTGYTCSCPPGYQGENCQTIVDPCTPMPRHENGGFCSVNENTPACTCVPGFTGTWCETEINECMPNLCNNEGQCVDEVNGFRCMCQPGFTGEHCATDIDECASNQCNNGATCVDGINGFSCVCAVGYSGELCENDEDECTSLPCLNGGTCLNRIGDYSCECPEQYDGTNCEHQLWQTCQENPCQHNSICRDIEGGFRCYCYPGFAGLQCQDNIDECWSNPCLNNGTCLDRINGVLCICPIQFDGNRCEIPRNMTDAL